MWISLNGLILVPYGVFNLCACGKGSIMHGAKINNLGLSFVIRFDLFVDYLSCLGGVAQRTGFQIRGKIPPAGKSVYPSHFPPVQTKAQG